MFGSTFLYVITKVCLKKGRICFTSKTSHTFRPEVSKRCAIVANRKLSPVRSINDYFKFPSGRACLCTLAGVRMPWGVFRLLAPLWNRPKQHQRWCQVTGCAGHNNQKATDAVKYPSIHSPRYRKHSILIHVCSSGSRGSTDEAVGGFCENRRFGSTAFSRCALLYISTLAAG